MIIKHKAGPKDWEGLVLPDDPGELVAAIPGVKDRKWGRCAHLVVLGIKEEQNRIATNERRKKNDPAVALGKYTPGCTYKEPPSVLDDIAELIKKGKVTPAAVVDLATKGLSDDQKALIKARVL